VHLDNGFVYSPDNWHDDYRVITDKKGNVIVPKDVYGLMIKGKTIYGPRKYLSTGGMHKNFFFICTYGEDCSKTQNYSKTEFNEEIKKRNLPPFDWKKMKNRRELIILEWKKHASISDALCYLYL
jgi:hypothetical protein